jgi:hypothetical protein
MWIPIVFLFRKEGDKRLASKRVPQKMPSSSLAAPADEPALIPPDF